MKTINILLLISIALLFSSKTIVQAQCIQIGYNYLQGIHYNSNWDLFGGGSEFYIKYLKETETIGFSLGTEYRTVQWGNQVSLSAGVFKPMNKKIEVGVALAGGLALFRPQSLFVFSAAPKMNYALLKKDKFSIGISLETRFTSCPAYKKYSNIYNLWEISPGVFFRF